MNEQQQPERRHWWDDQVTKNELKWIRAEWKTNSSWSLGHLLHLYIWIERHDIRPTDVYAERRGKGKLMLQRIDPNKMHVRKEGKEKIRCVLSSLGYDLLLSALSSACAYLDPRIQTTRESFPQWDVVVRHSRQEQRRLLRRASRTLNRRSP